MPWQGGTVRRIVIVIPDGHAGLTGIALGYGHNAVIPRTGRNYYSGNDRVVQFDYADTNSGVAWSAFLCNLDLQAHAWEVDFELDETPDAGGISSPSFIAPADILAAVTG